MNVNLTNLASTGFPLPPEKHRSYSCEAREEAKPEVSRNCRMMQTLVGSVVTLKCQIRL
jgi:hypothetical protein